MKKLLAALLVTASWFCPLESQAQSAAKIDTDSRAALADLLAKDPGARALAKSAQAILVFPSIVKAGFMLGGQYGTGALLENGFTVGYYRSAAASYGFQAGIQKFGYALFFMDEAALSYLKKSKGWAIGAAPSLVIVDEGFARTMNTTTLQKGIYAYCFDQKGLMGGLGLQGSKITRIFPE